MNEEKIKTYEHIRAVQQNLVAIATELLRRATCHDDSKLVEPEASIFESVTAELAGLTYGSDEYKESLKKLGPALEHHYRHNSHHPEHYRNGLAGFDLCDLVEMFCDWGAATMRHNDGCLRRSVGYNAKRFGYDVILEQIFYNSIGLVPNKSITPEPEEVLGKTN